MELSDGSSLLHLKMILAALFCNVSSFFLSLAEMPKSNEFASRGYSTLGWVRMCGPKFRPPLYNKTREDANLQPITKPFASWRTLFKTNQYFLPYKLGCISTFWQPIGKLKGKIQRKFCILQKCNLYLNQFSNKKGAIGKRERPKKHPIWAAHPRTHLSTKYPPRGSHSRDYRQDQRTYQVMTAFKSNEPPDVCVPQMKIDSFYKRFNMVLHLH